MRAELVDLVTKEGTRTVVLLSTDLQVLTSEEKARGLELALWLVDEGWTVTTTTNSPLAEVVRRGAEALCGTYVNLPDDAAAGVAATRRRLPPTSRFLGALS